MTYFNHPFASGNRIQLVDDFNLPKKLSVASLGGNINEMNENSNSRGRKSATKRLSISADVDDDNAFEFAPSI